MDDGSTDDTLDYVKDNLRSPLVSVKLKQSSQQGYARNLASKLFQSDYILFCDSDDQFLPHHILTAYQAISTSDENGKFPAIASTTARMDANLGIHSSWVPRISHTIPITKIVSRSAWEFIEGFPVHDLYKRTPVEDQDIMALFSAFFNVKTVNDETVEYRCYPGSSFEKQLPNFKRHPDQAEMSQEDRENLPVHKARQQFLQAKLELLKAKLIHDNWAERLDQFSTNFRIS